MDRELLQLVVLPMEALEVVTLANKSGGVVVEGVVMAAEEAAMELGMVTQAEAVVLILTVVWKVLEQLG